MKKYLIITMMLGFGFAANWMDITSLTDDGVGNVQMTIGFSFDDVVKGYELDLLSVGTDGTNLLTITDASSGSQVSGWTTSYAAGGKILGFDLSGGTVTGGGVLVDVTATYDVAHVGQTVSLHAVHTCDDDGTTACDPGDTKLLLAGVSGAELPVNFGMTSWTVGSSVTDLDAGVAPYEFGLSKNFPNPFNPTTTINYEIAKAGDVSIVIYDMVGREVKTLVSDFANPGSYHVVWNAQNNQGLEVSAGMYVYKMISGDFVKVNKMLLVK